MDLVPKLSTFAYRLIEQLEHWVSLPDSVSEAIDYRRSYADRLPKENTLEGNLWIHGASVGELEDLAAFFLNSALVEKSGWTFEQIIVTSSSPSALGRLEKWKKEYPFLYAGPIPPESSAEIDLFLSRLKPKCLLMSHTDYWPMLFQKASQLNGFCFFWYPEIERFGSNRFRKFLQKTRHKIFLRAPSKTFPSEVVLGHPRVERILARSHEATKRVEHVLSPLQCSPQSSKKNIIFGSAWPEDLMFFVGEFRKLPPVDQKKFHLVVVPHELKPHTVGQMKSILPEAHFVLKQGMLLEAYRAFDIAWVGGGFRSGLHNILEPILWGIPTVCGPKTRKQALAKLMESENCLWVIRNSADLKHFLFEGETPFLFQYKGKTPNLKSHLGSCDRLAEHLQEFNASNAQ